MLVTGRRPLEHRSRGPLSCAREDTYGRLTRDGAGARPGAGADDGALCGDVQAVSYALLGKKVRLSYWCPVFRPWADPEPETISPAGMRYCKVVGTVVLVTESKTGLFWVSLDTRPGPPTFPRFLDRDVKVEVLDGWNTDALLWQGCWGGRHRG